MPLSTTSALERGSGVRHGMLRSHADFIEAETWVGRDSRYAIELAIAKQFCVGSALPA